MAPANADDEDVATPSGVDDGEPAQLRKTSQARGSAHRVRSRAITLQASGLTRAGRRAARHYDEQALAVLLIAIATINVWNRLNVATRQVAGEWKP